MNIKWHSLVVQKQLTCESGNIRRKCFERYSRHVFIFNILLLVIRSRGKPELQASFLSVECSYKDCFYLFFLSFYKNYNVSKLAAFFILSLITVVVSNQQLFDRYLVNLRTFAYYLSLFHVRIIC